MTDVGGATFDPTSDMRGSMQRAAAIGISAALAAAACRGPDADRSFPPAPRSDAAAAESASSQTAMPKPSPIASTEGKAHGVVFVPAPQGSVAAIVREAMGPAAGEHRTLVVYVGASWCEPCRRFHHAAQAGVLDGELPRLAMLEFDADRDRDRLEAAGYGSKYIPLFALASADGTASHNRVEGAIKGEGAIDFIVPRLRDLLTRRGQGPDG